MSKNMIEVQHVGIEGTATVPETALPNMRKRGWYAKGEKPPAGAQAAAAVEVPAEIAELKGADLDAALDDAGLPKTGRADDKRARLAEHQQGDADPDVDPDDDVDPDA